MVSAINKQLLLTAYAYLFIMEQQKAQQGSEALQTNQDSMALQELERPEEGKIPQEQEFEKLLLSLESSSQEAADKWEDEKKQWQKSWDVAQDKPTGKKGYHSQSELGKNIAYAKTRAKILQSLVIEETKSKLAKTLKEEHSCEKKHAEEVKIIVQKLQHNLGNYAKLVGGAEEQALRLYETGDKGLLEFDEPFAEQKEQNNQVEDGYRKIQSLLRKAKAESEFQELTRSWAPNTELKEEWERAENNEEKEQTLRALRRERFKAEIDEKSATAKSSCISLFDSEQRKIWENIDFVKELHVLLKELRGDEALEASETVFDGLLKQLLADGGSGGDARRVNFKGGNGADFQSPEFSILFPDKRTFPESAPIVTLYLSVESPNVFPAAVESPGLKVYTWPSGKTRYWTKEISFGGK